MNKMAAIPLYGKKLKNLLQNQISYLKGSKFAANDQINNKCDARRLSALPRGYVHVYYNSFQTSFSLKPLGQPEPNLMWGLLGKWEHIFCKISSWSYDHDGHHAHMVKTFKIFFSNKKSYDLET